jgi:hypothetical protein
VRTSLFEFFFLNWFLTVFFRLIGVLFVIFFAC